MQTPHYPDTLLLIDGQWRESQDRQWLPVQNPATGQTIGRAARASAADLEAAVQAAVRGMAVWSSLPAVERARTLSKAAVLLRERADAIAAVLTQEQGKPLAEARAEALGAADFIDWAAAESQRLYGRLVAPRLPAVSHQVLKEPLGPVAAFTPWNFPINQAVRKVAVALGAGCTVILKAAEETPAAPAALVQAFVDAGVPAGVLNLVYGIPSDISNALIAHPAVRKISFTGSTAVGKELAALAGRHMKRATMELGGHAPVIVDRDADVALAVRSMGAAKFRNAGQICIAPTRFLVHQDVAAEFTQALAAHASGLRVGNGLTAETQMGPLANPRRLVAMQSLVNDAVACGAKVVAGGVAGDASGNFWQPTVLTDVPLSARLLNEEPFGPVAAVRTFVELDDAIAEANRLAYGLAGYAFTRSLKSAHALTQRVKVGMLWINQAATPWPELPFGGIGDSGYGSEGGPEAFEAYLNTRLVTVAHV